MNFGIFVYKIVLLNKSTDYRFDNENSMISPIVSLISDHIGNL